MLKEPINGNFDHTQTHRIDYGSNKALLKMQLTGTKGTCTAGEVPGYCFPQASKTIETGDHYEKSVYSPTAIVWI